MSNESNNSKVAIFGGTFNPIHYGHLALAECVLEEMNLDYIIFMPCNISPFKLNSNVALPNDRYKMCELACCNNPQFLVSDIELVRSGISYTIDTIAEVKRKFDFENSPFWIIGSDAFLELADWKYAKQLFLSVEFVVVLRPGDEISDIENYSKKYEISYKVVRSPEMDVSSSTIRRLIRDGYSARYLVPDNVCEYIKENHLYDKE